MPRTQREVEELRSRCQQAEFQIMWAIDQFAYYREYSDHVGRHLAVLSPLFLVGNWDSLATVTVGRIAECLLPPPLRWNAYSCFTGVLDDSPVLPYHLGHWLYEVMEHAPDVPFLASMEEEHARLAVTFELATVQLDLLSEDFEACRQEVLRREQILMAMLQHFQIEQ